MIGLKIGISAFVLLLVWIVYELYKSPLIREDEDIIDFDEDEEFLG